MIAQQQQQTIQQMQLTLQQMQLQQQQQQQQQMQQQPQPQLQQQPMLQGSYGEASILSQTLVYDPNIMGADGSGYNSMGNINMNNSPNTNGNNGYSPENQNNNINYANQQNYSGDQMYNINQGYNQSPNFGNNQSYGQGYDNQQGQQGQQGYDGSQQNYDGQQGYDQQQNYNNVVQNGYGGDGYGHSQGQGQGQGQGQEGYYNQNNNNYNMNGNDNNNNNSNNSSSNNNSNNQNNHINHNDNQYLNNGNNGNNSNILTSSALHLPGQGSGHPNGGNGGNGGNHNNSEDPSMNNNSGNNSGNLNMNGSQSNGSVESLPLDVRKLQEEIISWKKSHDAAQQKLNQLRQTLTQKSQENREMHNSLTQVTQDRLMLQELVHKREKEMDDLRSQYLNDVRQIRATDDDHSTIEQRIRMLNASILQLTKSSAGDRSVNLNVDAVHSVVKKKYLFGNTQPYLLNMFLEKYIMDSLLEEVFNKPFYVGFSLAKEVGLIHSWMNENNFSDQAVRFRQQLCYLSAKCPATQTHAAEEASRIAKVFDAKLEKLYYNWGGQAKVNLLFLYIVLTFND